MSNPRYFLKVASFSVILAFSTLAPTSSGAAEQPGRIYGSSGVAYGGILVMNPDAKFAVNLSANTFSTNTPPSDMRSKSDTPSLSSNGKIAFSSNRGGDGNRIYVMKSDGSAVKKLTSGKLTLKSGDSVLAANDLNPVISPDGKRVAFVSMRSGQETKSSTVDIFVVGTEGGTPRQVTKSESDRSSDAQIRALTWSPDSKHLAYRGTRSVPDANGNYGVRDVLGFIDPDGANEVKVVVNDCAGGNVIDWVADSVLYSYGGATQGCPATRYIIRSYSSGAAVEIPSEIAVDAASGPGAARLSADAKYVKYSHSVNNSAVLVTVGIDGTKVSEYPASAIAYGSWIWWSHESKLPVPYKYVIEPSSLTVKVAKKPIVHKLLAKLTSKTGEVLSVSGVDWTWIQAANGVTLAPDGTLVINPNAPKSSYSLQNSNAGKVAKMNLVIK